MRQSEGVTTTIAGVAMKQVQSPYGQYLQISSENPLRTLNSSPWGGGFGHHRFLMNRQVDKTYNEDDPAVEMEAFIAREGMNPHDTAGMLTAAWVQDVGFKEMAWPLEDEYGDLVRIEEGAEASLRVAAWVTVGLGNKARAGAVLPSTSLYPGTINTIIVIEGHLTDAAMVNAVITATEAKAAALQDLNTTINGQIATGTSTDAVLIAATGKGKTHRYAGTATALGYGIGRTVYEAILASGQLYELEMAKRREYLGEFG
ncbi:adenosylcobinamide amidohydrolase [Paenibacillus roseipurpureus]|uniref:Adenosylcobinamide amidohydrolase n=1 Tax=Paenibacillus roseopurpureus TaxID=2918901 RepID=A0AA96RLD9_9BACL|nr:adenosylcobinamide amidohydrolase [Paenibacillus sp. MBLB1832]WNR43072.1 adenosylcobinamide amidohydrolase [Paenibacillus sp. MBLB1832]